MTATERNRADIVRSGATIDSPGRTFHVGPDDLAPTGRHVAPADHLPADDPVRGVPLMLPRESASVREGRRHAVTCAPDHPRSDDIRLVTSELCANAVQHGIGETYTLTVEARHDGVRIAVSNSTDGSVPRVLEPGDDEVSGRGLRIVKSVATLTTRRTGAVVEAAAFLLTAEGGDVRAVEPS